LPMDSVIVARGKQGSTASIAVSGYNVQVIAQAIQFGEILVPKNEVTELPIEIAVALQGRNGLSIIPPSTIRCIDVFCTLGLGDKIFTISALWALHLQDKSIPIRFHASSDDMKWMNRIPFLLPTTDGLPLHNSKIINISNIELFSPNRLEIIKQRVEVEVEDGRFPINAQKIIAGDYYLFVPQANNPVRSLPPNIIKEIASLLPDNTIIIGKQRITESYGLENATGLTSLDTVFDYIYGCQGIVSVDTGLLYVAGAMGKPAIGLFNTIPPQFRTSWYPTITGIKGTNLPPCWPCIDSIGDKCPYNVACWQGITQALEEQIWKNFST